MFLKTHFVPQKAKRKHLLGLLAYFVFVLGPFVFLLLILIHKLFTNGSELIHLINYSERRATLLGNSFKLAAIVSFLGTITGALIAVVVWNSRKTIKKNFYWLFMVIVPIPPYIHALSWMYFSNAIKYIGCFHIKFSGLYASALVQIMSFLPLAIVLTLVGIERVDKSLIDAARVLKNDKHTLFKILIPLANPMIVASAGIMFVLSIVDYSIPSLFQFNVYSLEIFSEYSSSGSSSNAFLLSFPLLLIALLILVLSQKGLKDASLENITENRKSFDVFEFPIWLKVSQKLALFAFILQVLNPTLLLVFQTGSWATLFSLIPSVANELRFTFEVSIVTALVCIFPAYSVASILKTNGKYSTLLWMTVLIPVAIPASLTGIAMVSVFNQPVLQLLSGTIIMPVLGCMARFMPFSVIIILAQLRRINPLLIDAANLLKENSFEVWLKIKLPMIIPGILASICTVFILTSGELGATLLLIPPGYETITIKIYNYMHYGANEIVAGLCLLMMLTVLFCGAIAIKVMKEQRKWFE